MNRLAAAPAAPAVPAALLAVLSLAVVLLPPAAPAVHAQENAQEAVADRTSCDYATCALRIQGRSILAGEEGREIARLGWIDAPELRGVFRISEPALRHFEIVDENYRSGRLMELLGTAALVGGAVLLRGADDDTGRGVGLGMEVVGLGLNFVGIRRTQRAREALTDAVWWYNYELARMEGIRLAGPDAPSAAVHVP